MGKIIGIVAADRIVAGLVKGNRVVGALRFYPEPASENDGLYSVPADEMALLIRRQIELLAAGETVDAVGVGFAGVIREGLIEESPNLQQAKGFHLRDALSGTSQAVLILNDADAMAAGIAATEGRLESVIRQRPCRFPHHSL
jgi:predicted NBD/HSP70 family sugar kinase